MEMLKKEILKLNNLYNNKHGLTDSDLIIVKNHIKNIENLRNEKNPQIGDIVEFTNKYGEFYKNAHIDTYNDYNNTFDICETPYIPFVKSSENSLSFSTSGGAWKNIPKKELKYAGRRKKIFCDWGHDGACANGSINFFATVNVWRYEEPGSLFGNYSTEFFNKMTFTKNNNDSKYKILGSGLAFENDEDYEAFKKTYRAKTFESNFIKNMETLFIYKEKNHYITKDEWDQLENCLIDTRLSNGTIITVKVKYDEKNKNIDTYRYKNSFEKSEQIANKPYILNRIKIKE